MISYKIREKRYRKVTGYKTREKNTTGVLINRKKKKL